VSALRIVFAVIIIAYSSVAGAQSASSVFQLFNGLVGTAITQAALSEWRKLRLEEIQCLDQRLQQDGQSIQAAIQQGIMPDDPRVAGARAACQTSVALTNPSFDCARAARPDEQAICASAELSRLDQIANSGYEFLRRIYGPQRANSLALPLLRARQACASDIVCIKSKQLAAIRYFQSLGAPLVVPPLDQQEVASIYSIDGFAVGGSVSKVRTYSDYICRPSAQFASLDVCERKQDETVARGTFTSTYDLLRGQDGEVAVISRLLEPAWFSQDEAKDDIGRQAKKYHEQPKLLQFMPANTAGISGVLATWGGLALRPLSDDERQAFLGGNKIRVGLLVDYLGDTVRSMQLGLPVYEATGAEGFVYAANWDAGGVGTLKLLAAAPSKLNGAAIAVGIDVKAAKAQELKTKFEVLSKKAGSGDVDAALALSDAYMSGDGVERNPGNAIHWLRMSADKGDPRAMTKLALNMITGNGIPKDLDAALKLLTSAAEKNNAEAAFELGKVYDRGDGVAADATQAFHWFEKADSLGSEPAKARIEEGRAAVEAARSVRNKLEDRLGSIKAEGLRQRVFDQSVTLASANERMNYADLAKIHKSMDAANGLVAELDDLDRTTKLADSLVAQVEDELKKITSDDPLIGQLQLNIRNVQGAIASQDLSKLQGSMANLSNLFKANAARLHAMEFHAL
jgi:TPR repeat protein